VWVAHILPTRLYQQQLIRKRSYENQNQDIGDNRRATAHHLAQTQNRKKCWETNYQE